MEDLNHSTNENISCLILCLIAANSCNQSDEEARRRHSYTEEVKQTFRFIPLSYGIGTAQTSETIDDSESITGHKNYIDDFSITKKTDTIPAKLGTEFGIRFKLRSNIGQSILLKKIWIFPKPINNGHKEFSAIESELEVVPNDSTFSSYRLEEDYELVRGNWQLLLYYKADLLYRKVFIVQ